MKNKLEIQTSNKDKLSLVSNCGSLRYYHLVLREKSVWKEEHGNYLTDELSHVSGIFLLINYCLYLIPIKCEINR